MSKFASSTTVSVANSKAEIERLVERYGAGMPLRYYGGGGEPPVLSANDALRFCRKQDAERLAKDLKLVAGYRITEHKWVNAPAQSSSENQS